MKDKNKKNGSFINNVNFLVSTTTIKGNIKTENDIRIDGKVEGNITCSGKLVIGTSGEVVGEIRSKSADISGRIKGKVFIEEEINLRETAIVEGEITTVKISIEPGAIFNGTCNMTKGGNNQQQEKK